MKVKTSIRSSWQKLLQLYLLIFSSMNLWKSTLTKQINIDFKTDWCKKDKIYYQLEAVFSHSPIQYRRLLHAWAVEQEKPHEMSKDILHSGEGSEKDYRGSSHSFLDLICQKGSSEEPSPLEYRYYCEDHDENFKSRLEFLNQLERQESQKYGTSDCDSWFQALNFKQKTITIYCGLRNMTDKQYVTRFTVNDYVLNQQIYEHDKLFYQNLYDDEILVMYLDLTKVSSVYQVVDMQNLKNIIIRYKFSECLNTQESEKLQGIGVNFRVQDYYYHTANNPEYLRRWLLKTESYDDLIYLLQNHHSRANIPIDEDPSSQELPKHIQSQLLKSQYAVVNYQILNLTKDTAEPLYLHNQVKQIYKNSRILEQYTDDSQKLYQNILRLSSHYKDKIFLPKFDNKSTHIYFQSKNEKFDKNQRAQFYLYIDIKPNYYQTMLLEQLYLLSKDKDFAFDLYISVYSKDLSDTNYKDFVHCILSEEHQSIALEMIMNLNNLESFVNTCGRYYNKREQLENLIDNSQHICSEQNICTFPFMMVHDQILEQQELLTFIWKYKDGKKLRQMLKEISYIQIEKYHHLNKEFDYFEFVKEIGGNYSHKFTSNVTNNWRFNYEQEKRIYMNQFDINKLNYQNKVILISAISQSKRQDKIVSFSQIVQELQNENPQYENVIFNRIVSPHTTLIKGILPFSEDIYIFINGKYIGFNITDKSQLRLLIDEELQKIEFLLEGVSLKEKRQVFQLMTELNYMDILNYQVLNVLEELDFLKTYEPAHDFSKDLQSSPTKLQIHGKLCFLSYESVAFLSYLNQSGFSFSIKIYSIYNNMLFNHMRRYPYHYYRLQMNNQKTDTLVFDEIEKPPYPQLYIDIYRTQGLNFVISKLSHYNSFFFTNPPVMPIFGHNYTQELNYDYFRDLLPENEQVFMEYSLKQMQKILLINEAQSDLYIQKTYLDPEQLEFFILHDRFNIARNTTRIMKKYIYAIVSQPGRYYVTRENTGEVIKIDFDGMHYSDTQTSLDFQKFIEEIPSRPIEHQFTFINEPKQTKIDQVNIYYQVSGSEYETLLLHQIYQMIKIDPSENFKYFIIENEMISPDFRNNLLKLQSEIDFELEFLNFAWPERILKKPTNPYHQAVMYRILFMDQMFNPEIGRVIYKDTDQCFNLGTKIRELFEEDLKGKPIGMTLHGDHSILECYVYRNQNLSARNPQLKVFKNYYQAAVILQDINRLVVDRNLERVREYYDTQLYEGQLTLQFHDQDLINFSQDLMPIQAIPWYWMWSFELYGNETKQYAKNIDMYKTIKQIFEPIMRTTKFQAAEMKCPMFENTFSELDLLLNDGNNYYELLTERGRVRDTPMKMKFNIKDLMHRLLHQYDNDWEQEFRDIKVLDFITADNQFIIKDMRFSLLGQKLFDFKQYQETFTIEGKKNIQLEGQMKVFFTDHEMNYQDLEVPFFAIVEKLKFSYILGYKKTFEPEGIHLFIQNYSIQLNPDQLEVKKHLDEDKMDIIKKIIQEKIQKNLLKIIFTSQIFYEKEIYIKPQELLNKIYHVSDYYQLQKQLKSDNLEQHFLEFGLTLKDWLPFIQQQKEAVTFKDYPIADGKEVAFSWLINKHKDLLRQVVDKQEYLNYHKIPQYYIAKALHNSTLTTNNIQSLVPNIKALFKEEKKIKLEVQYSIPRSLVKGDVGIMVDEDLVMTLNIPANLRLSVEKAHDTWYQFRHYYVIINLRVDLNDKKVTQIFDKIKLGITQLVVAENEKILEDETLHVRKKLEKLILDINTRIQSNLTHFIDLYEQRLQLWDLDVKIHNEANFVQIDLLSSEIKQIQPQTDEFDDYYQQAWDDLIDKAGEIQFKVIHEFFNDGKDYTNRKSMIDISKQDL